MDENIAWKRLRKLRALPSTSTSLHFRLDCDFSLPVSCARNIVSLERNFFHSSGRKVFTLSIWCKTFPSDDKGRKRVQEALTFAPGFREAVAPARQQRQHLHHDRQLEEHPAAAQPPRRASLPQGRGRCPRRLLPALPAPPWRGPGPGPGPGGRCPRRGAEAEEGSRPLPRSGKPLPRRLGPSSPRPQKWSRPSPRPAPGRGEETGEGRGPRSMRAPVSPRGPGGRGPFPPVAGEEAALPPRGEGPREARGLCAGPRGCASAGGCASGAASPSRTAFNAVV